jgi:hypothetical protein
MRNAAAGGRDGTGFLRRRGAAGNLARRGRAQYAALLQRGEYHDRFVHYADVQDVARQAFHIAQAMVNESRRRQPQRNNP